ncbi:MAG: choice-of-anchor Q domain-containing protein [Bacteroidota bacterium]
MRRNRNFVERCFLGLFFLTILFCSTTAFGAIILVPSDYSTIQAGIDAALNGDTVFVADGIYTGEGNKNLDFKGKAITVQSANGADNSIIDCENNGNGFQFTSDEGQDSKVIGFTITNGRFFQGGGIYVYNASPTISNCIIKNNSTQYTYGDYYGGGIYLKSNNPLLEHIYPIVSNCIIAGNKSGRRGGGIFLDRADATITNSIIVDNSTGSDFDAGGGGIYNYNLSSDPTITNCIIRGNFPNQGHTASSTYSNIEGQTSGEGNIDIHPAFVDAVNGDYHLKDFSPCIGAGTNTGTPDTDIEGNPRPNPAGSNPDIGAYENPLSVQTIRPLDDLDIFGIEKENQWSYDSNIQRKITKIDQTTFPKMTYEMEIIGNGLLIGKEWYESSNGQLLLWGESPYLLDKGLVVAWYPLYVGKQKVSSAKVVGYPGTTISMRVDVLSFEEITLGLGTFDSYRLGYRIKAEGPGGTSTQKFKWWVVPYLGVIKQSTPDGKESLISFSIDGGNITETTDHDNDDLLDYQELAMHNTNPFDSDTDDDGIPDGVEDKNTNGIVESDETDPSNFDTDWDGIQDGTESGLTLADIGPDTDLAIFQPDLDPLTTTNPLKTDSDGDRASDGKEDKNSNGRIDDNETNPNDPKSYPVRRSLPWLDILLDIK